MDTIQERSKVDLGVALASSSLFPHYLYHSSLGLLLWWPTEACDLILLQYPTTASGTPHLIPALMVELTEDTLIFNKTNLQDITDTSYSISPQH